jgi:hypothetical protein
MRPVLQMKRSRRSSARKIERSEGKIAWTKVPLLCSFLSLVSCRVVSIWLATVLVQVVELEVVVVVTYHLVLILFLR